MTIQDIRVRTDNGSYNVAVTLKSTDVQVDEYEGTGDTLSEALYDLGDYLAAANA